MKNRYFLIAILAVLCTVANAQKLPTKQQNSVPAPANIKIDGKLTEWDNQLQAYNEASRVFYTISNDAANLYLTIKMDSQQGTEKALTGGITLSILSPTDKSKKIEITYHAQAYEEAYDELRILPNKFKETAKEANKPKMDSLIRVANDMIGKFYKDVLIKGIKEIKDPIIPIYNEHDIVLAARLNENMEYVYELALPLKLLTGFIPSTNIIKYKVNVNWLGLVRDPGLGLLRFNPTKEVNFNLMYQNNDTGFGGNYTLAK